jgi:proteic killer suppression protein
LEVRFRTRHLEQCYLESKVAIREFGAEVGRRYVQRIQIVRNTRSVGELRGLPGLRFHALKGSRDGQFAINLTGFYRLIVTLEGAELQIVRIEEVSKHYGD